MANEPASTPVADAINQLTNENNPLTKEVVAAVMDDLTKTAKLATQSAFGAKYGTKKGTVDQTDNAIDLTDILKQVKDEVIAQIPTAVNKALTSGTIQLPMAGISDATVEAKLNEMLGIGGK